MCACRTAIAMGRASSSGTASAADAFGTALARASTGEHQSCVRGLRAMTCAAWTGWTQSTEYACTGDDCAVRLCRYIAYMPGSHAIRSRAQKSKGHALMNGNTTCELAEERNSSAQ